MIVIFFFSIYFFVFYYFYFFLYFIIFTFLALYSKTFNFFNICHNVCYQYGQLLLYLLLYLLLFLIHVLIFFLIIFIVIFTFSYNSFYIYYFPVILLQDIYINNHVSIKRYVYKCILFDFYSFCITILFMLYNILYLYKQYYKMIFFKYINIRNIYYYKLQL